MNEMTEMYNISNAFGGFIDFKPRQTDPGGVFSMPKYEAFK